MFAGLELIRSHRERSRNGASCVLAFVLLICWASGCKSSVGQDPSQLTAALQPYQPGGWRLARHELANVAFSLSHILIEHVDSKRDQTNLRFPGFQPGTGSKRPRVQAQELAAKLSVKLRADPSQFEAEARKTSDDPLTRASGGSLGIWSAELIIPEFLDALQTMKAGEVSRVIESPLGYHIVKRQKLPAEHSIAGKRVLITYRGTAPNLLRADRPVAPRSRDQAQELAKKVSSLARKEPAKFSALVQEYSDHADVVRGGDIGVWSSHRAGLSHLEFDRWGGLKPGEVSEALESRDGFVVFLREAATPRPELAYDEIVPSPDSDPVGRATALIEVVRRSPERFDELQKTYCCRQVNQAPEGKGTPAIEAALKSLAIGEIAPQLVQLSPESQRIVRRVAPESHAPLAKVTDVLPSRTEPDLAYIVEHSASADALATALLSIHLRAGGPEALGLSQERGRKLVTIVTDLSAELRKVEPSARMTAVRGTLDRIARELGKDVADAYFANIKGELTRSVL